MVNFNIEETWVQLNNLIKAPIYFDRRLEVLYYGSEFNKDDSRYHIATCDHLFLPEVSDKNVITFSKSVPWDKVTITDIRAVANGVRVVLGEIDLRPLYRDITQKCIYRDTSREDLINEWASR